MHLALLARYLDGDLWEARLCAAIPEEPLPVDEFNALSALSGCAAASSAIAGSGSSPTARTTARKNVEILFAMVLALLKPDGIAQNARFLECA